MRAKLISALLFALLCIGHLSAVGEKYFLGAPKDSQIAINNRVLIKVNNKPLSVIDIAKKMDMIFFKQYPQFADSQEARYQFYKMSWRGFLNNQIEQELILADAIENKLPVSNGDVRQEIEEIFGPNIHSNLEKAGLTYEEAWEIVKDDILLKRMMYFRVNSKVLKKVTPYVVRAYYEEWSKKNIVEPECTYHMISVRAKDSNNGAITANHAYYLLNEKHIPLDELTDTLKNDNMLDPGTQVTISEKYTHKHKEIAPQNREILCKLGCEEVSPPTAQKSRQDNQTVFRLFYVKDFQIGGAVPYADVEDRLRNELLDKEMALESEAYINKLKKHHNMTAATLAEYISDNFEPFVLTNGPL